MRVNRKDGTKERQASEIGRRDRVEGRRKREKKKRIEIHF